MKKIAVLWTNDDITTGQAEHLGRQIEWLEEFGIPGTFFVVPIRSIGPIDEDEDLVSLIRSARKGGHEFHQHGTRHGPFECGVPETWMLDFSP